MKATVNTNRGTIVLELDSTAAPLTCANFKQYADDGHFNGTIFHRVIPNFMIQGGGFDADMNQKATRENIQNEAANGLVNAVGSIAMARTPDPHSASSQFFINLNDNDFLNYKDDSQAGFGYCVFGKTIEGMDVVNDIATVATGNVGGHGDVPTETILIESVTVE